LFLRIKRKEPGLPLDRMRAAAAVVAAPSKDQAGLGFPSQRDDTLVGNEIAIVLDGPVLRWIPDAQCSSQLPIRGLTPDVDQPFRTVNHGPRTKVAVANSTERNRVGI